MKACRGSTGTRSRDGTILAGSRRCLARCGGPQVVGGTAVGRGETVLLVPTGWKHQASHITYSQRVYSANAFRMDSSNPALATKSCAWAYIALLEPMISWSIAVLLKVGDWSVLCPGRLTSGEAASGNIWVGKWVGPKTSWTIWRRKKNPLLPHGIKPIFLGCPINTPVTHSGSKNTAA